MSQQKIFLLMSDGLIFIPDAASFFSGAFGGACGVAVGQPFDIIKVRLQNTGGKSVSLIYNLVKNEGVLAFWKGSSACLLGACLSASISFGVVENTKTRLLHSQSEPLSLLQHSLTGFLSGSCTSIISTVSEGIRIKIQTQGYIENKGDAHYSSSLKYSRDLLRLKGIKGLFRGFIPTYFRDAIGDTFYFTVYNGIPIYLYGSYYDDSQRTFFNIFLSGGLAGVAYWAFTYPIDVLKTRVQSDSITSPKYSGNIDCLLQIVRQEGVRALFHGISPCLLRAFPVNTGIFLGFESLKRLMIKLE
jgi:solute carrier family 25 (mitochondrial carnitine/acylcarnitine transporter), member 20/29